MTDSPNGEKPAEAKPDALVELTFVPSWARRPPDTTVRREGGGAMRPGGGMGRRDDRDDRRRLPRRSDAGGGRRPGGRPGDGRDGQGERRRPAFDGRPMRREAAPQPPLTAAPAPIVGIDVGLIPERNGLVPLVARLRRTGRTHSLFHVARIFLTKPEYFAVRLVATGPNAARLYQCRRCGLVFCDRGGLVAHILARHEKDFYTKEEKEIPPPEGKFICVARCRRSGALLGPPNYHTYNDSLVNLHRTRFPRIPFDQFRMQIENVHDTELVEKWRKEAARETTYKPCRAGATESFTRLSQLEPDFEAHHAADAIREGDRFVVPGKLWGQIEDPGIRNAIARALLNERRHPLRLSIALRSAFKHLGMHILRTGDGSLFVAPVEPSALDPAQTVDVIRRLLETLAARPGCERHQLLEAMAAGTTLTENQIAEITNHLRWLVGKGHVIEFADGRLALPRTRTQPREGIAKPRDRGAARPHARPAARPSAHPAAKPVAPGAAKPRAEQGHAEPGTGLKG